MSAVSVTGCSGADEAEHVKVVFDVKGHRQDLDVTIPKLVFNSKQGWSGAAEVTDQYRQQHFHIRPGKRQRCASRALHRHHGALREPEPGHRPGAPPFRLRQLPRSMEPRHGDTFCNIADSAVLDTRIYRTRQDFEPALTSYWRSRSR